MSEQATPNLDDAGKRAIIERTLDAIAAGDWEAATANVVADFVQEWPQSGERITGRDHCLVVWRNYPGGMPSMSARRIRGSGDFWSVESTIKYPSSTSLVVSLMEFRDGKLARQVDYFADPFPAPAWRSQWVTLDPNMASG